MTEFRHDPTYIPGRAPILSQQEASTAHRFGLTTEPAVDRATATLNVLNDPEVIDIVADAIRDAEDMDATSRDFAQAALNAVHKILTTALADVPSPAEGSVVGGPSREWIIEVLSHSTPGVDGQGAAHAASLGWSEMKADAILSSGTAPLPVDLDALLTEAEANVPRDLGDWANLAKRLTSALRTVQVPVTEEPANRDLLTEDLTRFLLAEFGQPVAWVDDELGTPQEWISVVGDARKIAESLVDRFTTLPSSGTTTEEE